jgi:ketosteroid isomerase-like protein
MANTPQKAVSVIIASLFASATYSTTPDQVQALDRQWAKATMHADVAALDRLLADDLTYTHTDGDTQTKRQFIDSIRKGDIRYDSIRFEDSNIRVYGNTAVILSHLRIKLTSGSKDVYLHPCFLNVWVRMSGRWQMVAHQATRID